MTHLRWKCILDGFKNHILEVLKLEHEVINYYGGGGVIKILYLFFHAMPLNWT